ncbi:hypothetical protein TWF481_010917 [Arthrobotrys musiformis]|uniref:Uncharacterized protein n=1 Tax=Arthrobotrys musiformis TaxID=47236 RepID=A0AAV9VWS9_9PEZI
MKGPKAAKKSVVCTGGLVVNTRPPEGTIWVPRVLLRRYRGVLGPPVPPAKKTCPLWDHILVIPLFLPSVPLTAREVASGLQGGVRAILGQAAPVEQMRVFDLPHIGHRVRRPEFSSLPPLPPGLLAKVRRRMAIFIAISSEKRPSSIRTVNFGPVGGRRRG